MNKGSVFEYSDFRIYLEKRLVPFGKSRGMRSKLSQILRVKPSYMSKIISGKIQLSLEHVPLINRFLEHSESESEFFMQLVLYTQAGSKELELYFKNKMNETIERSRVAADWVRNKEEIPEELQARFFSEWQFSVINVLTHIHSYQTKAAIATRLKLSQATVSNTVEFLVAIGLLEQKGDRYIPTQKRVHLKKNSPWISNYHAHVRNLAVRSLTEPEKEDYHYSFVMTLSNSDRSKIRALLQSAITEIEPVITQSKDEELCSLAVDFFRI